MTKPLSEVYFEIGNAWADAEAAASILEDLRSAFLSQKMQPLIEQGVAVNKAEAAIKASLEWRDYSEKQVAARKKANLLKVHLASIKMRAGEQASEEANHRAAHRL